MSFVSLLAGALALMAPAPQAAYDIILRGGMVVDGTGAPPFRADVAIEGDTIALVGRLEGVAARREIDASGRIVTPGFIDLHHHGDDEDYGASGLRSPDPRRRAAQNYVSQGVTTAVVNQDGSQPPSLVEQRAELERLGVGLNAILLNGHNTLRRLAMGTDVERAARPDEIAAMQEILRRGLEEEGSFGLSLGLEYESGLYSDPEEQLALGQVLGKRNGVFISHMRSQGSAPMWYQPSQHGERPPPTMADSIAETLRVAEETGATVVATHMKMWGPGFRGRAREWIARIQEARDRGARIYIDTYPYDSAGSDGDFRALPPWAIGADRERGKDFDYAKALRVTLESPEKKEALARDVEHRLALKGGTENVRVLDYRDPSYVGKSFAELMAERKLGAADLAIALQLDGDPALPGGVRMRAFSMMEEDVAAFYELDWCATATDGWIVLPEEAVGVAKYVDTNRRCFGSYPRRLAHYALELEVDSLEHAVRSASGLPASILGLLDRGRLAPGMKADIAVLDLDRLRDNTTYLEPSVYATGVDYVLVNGELVVDEGRRTLALPGRVLDPVGRPARRATC